MVHCKTCARVCFSPIDGAVSVSGASFRCGTCSFTCSTHPHCVHGDRTDPPTPSHTLQPRHILPRPAGLNAREALRETIPSSRIGPYQFCKRSNATPLHRVLRRVCSSSSGPASLVGRWWKTWGFVHRVWDTTDTPRRMFVFSLLFTASTNPHTRY